MSAAPRRAAPVAVTGAGVVSPLGDRPEIVFDALCRGESALAPVAAFDASGLPSRLAAEVRAFEPQRYLGAGNLRPLDRTGRLAAAAAALALADAGWDAEARQGAEVGLALGTMFGSVHTISQFDQRALTAGPIYAKPMDFANSVINAAAGQTAIWHDLRGVNSTLSGGTTGGLAALAYGADLVAAGRADAVLAGGAEELCFESFQAFARAGLTAGSTATNGDGRPGPAGSREHPVPLDAARNGFAPGEAAALLVLETADSARRRGARVLATLRGSGTAFDPRRGRDDESAAAAVARAVEAALADAGLAPEEIGLLSLGASGSVAGDRREAAGLARVFGEGLADLPATAVKSMLGEPLGAGGALQALAAMAALAEGRLPGIRGFGRPGEEPVPSVDAAARPLAEEARTALVTALDFDGGACAVVLSLGDS